MDNKEDKRIEELIDKLMKEDQLESPSSNFTANLMQKLNEDADQKRFVYQPIISGKTWILIAVVLFFLSVYFFNNQIGFSSAWGKELNFNLFKDGALLKGLSNAVKTNSTFYSVAILGLFILIQIPFLKHHFEKSLKG